MTVLELHEVTKTYGTGHTAVRAVDGVDLSLGEGELVLIMGPSGSGKTTLLSMAGTLLHPTTGEVRVNGTSVGWDNPEALRWLRVRKIGFIFQAFNLLSALTALENVEVVLNLAGMKGRPARERAAQLLSGLGLEKRLGHHPYQLSGGEKQRVAIARALANDPRLILADEPTGNLDSASGQEVMMLLYDMAREQGRGVLVVSHDTRIIDISHRVLWLQDGILSPQPREAEALARDPVCGMRVSRRGARFIAQYTGKDYHFCSQKCLDCFQHDPASFAARAGQESGDAR